MKQIVERSSSIATLLVAGLLFVTGTTTAQTRPFSTAPLKSSANNSVDEDTFAPLHIGSNVNVTNKSGAQSETSVGVDPTNPLHVLESVNDLTNTAAVYESFDGGATWANSNLTTSGAFC